MTTVRTKKKRHNFVIVDKTILEDKRLSYKARGLAAMLLCKPDNWSVNIDYLVSSSDKDGKEAVQSAIKELEKVGYVARYRKRIENNKIQGWEFVLFECLEDSIEWRKANKGITLISPLPWDTDDGVLPSSGKPSDGIPDDGVLPSSGKPSDGKPSDGKPVVIINNIDPINIGQKKEEEGAAQSAAPSLSSEENTKQQENQFTVTPSDQNLNNVNSNETTSTQEDRIPAQRRKVVTTSYNAKELPPYKLSKEEFRPEFVEYWLGELAKSPHWLEIRKETPLEGDAKRSLFKKEKSSPRDVQLLWEAFLERKEKTEVAIATRERLVAEELPQIEALTPIDSTALKERLMQRAKNAKYRHLRNKN